MAADVTLLVAGQAWDSWTSYELEADYLTPADGWSVTARNPNSLQLALLRTGLPVILQVAGQPILRGLLERVESSLSRDGGHEITLSGRDLAAPLVDCSPGVTWSFKNLPLSAVAQMALSELGVAATVLAAPEALVPRRSIKAEPGETYWEVLERYAKKARLGLWMSPLGVLTIGRPTYTSAPVGIVKHSTVKALRGGNNILSARYTEDLSGQRSPVTVVGQGAGGAAWPSASQITGAYIDADLTSRGLLRPILIDDGEVSSIPEAIARARWEVSYRAFQARQLEVEVAGHLCKAVPPTAWAPDQMVGVQDDLHGIVGVWWLRAVRMTRDRDGGTRTALTLHPPLLYLPAA